MGHIFEIKFIIKSILSADSRQNFHPCPILIYDPWYSSESCDIGCWSAYTEIFSDIFIPFSEHVFLWYNDIMHSCNPYNKILFFKEYLQFSAINHFRVKNFDWLRCFNKGRVKLDEMLQKWKGLRKIPKVFGANS